MRHKHEAAVDSPDCTECGRTAQVLSCAHEGCSAKALSFSQWDNMRFHEQGWTSHRDGTYDCPDHMPSWALGRRLAKEEGLAVDG